MKIFAWLIWVSQILLLVLCYYIVQESLQDFLPLCFVSDQLMVYIFLLSFLRIYGQSFWAQKANIQDGQLFYRRALQRAFQYRQFQVWIDREPQIQWSIGKLGSFRTARLSCIALGVSQTKHEHPRNQYSHIPRKHLELQYSPLQVRIHPYSNRIAMLQKRAAGTNCMIQQKQQATLYRLQPYVTLMYIVFLQKQVIIYFSCLLFYRYVVGAGFQ